MIKRSFVLFFLPSFFKVACSIDFQCVLAYVIERKIVLASDDCSRPPIIIKSHDLRARDIRGPMGEIASYHKKD
jgi:hypothetical protein